MTRHIPVTEEVRKAALRRLNRFMELTTAPLLLSAVSWGGDPTKEITESLACWEAVMQWVAATGRSQRDRSMSVLVVGDGRSPRTGALVACMSAWTVTSIDPKAASEGPHPTVQRLTTIRARLEERPDLRADVVIAPHSHASPEATRAACLPGGVVVAMPCCVPWAVLPHTRTYADHACLSPDRTVYVETY